MAHLSLSLLGTCEAMLDGQPLTGFRTHKGRALLVYLAVHAERAHGREALATLVWPEHHDEAARTYLRQALANLRGLLGDLDPSYLLITRESVRVNLASNYTLDVTSFRALLIACAQHAHRDATTWRECARHFAQALGLSRGDLLEQFLLGDSATFQEWAVLKGEQLHHQVLGALARRADYCARRALYEEAQHWPHRQLELAPWREEPHHQLMGALWRSGLRVRREASYPPCHRFPCLAQSNHTGLVLWSR